MQLSKSILLLMIFTSSILQADTLKLSLPHIFSDHMVLQRNQEITIWGSTKAKAKVTVRLGKDLVSSKADSQGKWKVLLAARKANNQPVSLIIKSAGETKVINDILVGDIWLGSGQSNMEFPLKQTHLASASIAAANEPQIRCFHVPKTVSNKANSDINATWKLSSPKSIPDFSAVLYHFGKRLHDDLDVPIALINSSWGGSKIASWMSSNDKPGEMYNGMIAPLRDFKIKGCIWYQGEANVIKKDGEKYFGMMKSLIEGWRQFWGSDMPFYFVQIAPWSVYEAGELPSLWQAQLKTLKLPATGMVVVTDLVDNINDIHPKKKYEVGNRLALWALAKTYGKKDLFYSGPLMEKVVFQGKNARVHFKYADGLKSSDGKELKEFKIAGADGIYINAKAKIYGETVVLSANGLTPVSVQFGWHKIAKPNLVNKANLPASPFQSNKRTDETGK
ncbi:sialate O-acetylesterase [Lentisphaera profundi]|uniref:Sialate O-acetylesterase n=1 Tax=Lentisphaera profundi TaxID=1658616 RepID=A0ABY7VP76_9BACT|nr:sialate O-acetylesterase [Lentisphaera profundi]WDE95762.1 sialate O-acetylesterase [Lentisphaera profundi]